MMDQAIKDFPKQFGYEPVIENEDNLKRKKRFIVCGMGGSNLSAGLLKIVNPKLDIISHRDYGLPTAQGRSLDTPRTVLGFGEHLVIASSYSGNTEEVIDAFNTALEKGFALAVISTGGELIERAKKHAIPFIQIPQDRIQPRLALGLNIRSLMKFMGDEEGMQQTRSLADSLNGEECEQKGKALSGVLRGKLPVIYTSARNQPIAYNWKVKFNETAKIPVFYNVFPELNHNEMIGFSAGGGSAFGGDSSVSNRSLSDTFHFIFLRDELDNPRILKRMDMTSKLYTERGLEVEMLTMAGQAWQKIFTSLLIADWTAFYIAKHYGTEPEEVPMVEEFKKLIA